MDFSKRRFLVLTTFIGAVAGYVFLHPFGMIVHAFFHLHADEGYLHLHWEDVIKAFRASFSFVHLPEAFSYVILSAVIGWLFGKTILAYRLINENLRAFSIIGENASGIIHDLSNPVAGIVASTRLIKEEVKTPEAKKYFDIMERQIKRLTMMIMDIRINAQKGEIMQLSKQPTDIKEFLTSVIAQMNLHHKIEVASDIKGQVLIDRTYMERVIWNVVKNSDEALMETEDGKIEISADEGGKFVTICISDNGPGIPRKVLKRLFNLGQTFGKKGGSGIGLHNCKKIVEAHGGGIWLVSQVNKGTKAYIKIPKGEE